jgi:SNF2 family DNA or RNA helicase
MSKYKINDLVIRNGRPERRGIVKKILSKDGGMFYYDVIFFDGQTGSYAEIELCLADIPNDPWQLFANNQHRGHEEFGLVTTFHKVRNTTNNTLSTLRASRTDFKPYQYKPLVKFLNSVNRRILVADEVGLGKTIEAGHIMLEMAGRGELKNSLIVCPKSLKDKWQTEMREKFNFEFKIIESRKELLSDFSHCKATGEPLRCIVTYDSVRTKTKDRRDLTQELNPVILAFEDSGQFFDLTVCDEAHYVRNPNLRHRGLEKVIEASKACVFLTATPLMTGIQNLYYILRLLDGEAFYREEQFQNAINLNKPFIRALNRLNNREPLDSILTELTDTEVPQTLTIGEDYNIQNVYKVSEYFKDDPLFNRVVTNLKAGKTGPSILSSIQKDLTDLNSLNHIYTRTRKREVFTDGKIAFRSPKNILVDLSQEEMDAYIDVIEEYAEEPLALVQKKRLITSSIPSYFGSEEELSNGIVNWNHRDSKFEHFKIIINEVVVKNNRKLIVFATFRKTLLYLKSRLEKENIRCVLMYGDTKNRQNVIDQFRENQEIKVFLSSQVGTEGVDLQFCNAIVNYDLPWNPMIVEQRIGRIDRIGQKDEIIHIYTLVLRDTIEQQIHTRLLERIHVFKESVGDLESILSEDGSPFEKSLAALEKELYGNKLTPKQIQKKIDDIAVAIENQKRDLEDIKKELTDSMVNDIYFENAINNIINNQQYITDREIIFFVRWIIREHLQSILFHKKSDFLYEIELPVNNKSIIQKFIADNIDLEANKEIKANYFRFINRHRDSLSLKVTFNQEYAKENPNTEYINAYHPIVLAITNFIEKENYHINQIFQYSISNTFLSDTNYSIPSGDYMMCVYKIIVEQENNIQKRSNDYLHPVVLDANIEGNFKFLTDDESLFLHGKLQQYAEEIKEPLAFDSETIESIRPNFQKELNKIKDKYQTEEQIRLESYKQRALKQMDEYYSNLIDRYKRQIELRDMDDKVMPIFRQRLQDAIDKYEEKRSNILQTKTLIDNALISISYIQIY